MKKIGIVVEYNPFHNGHLYQIQKIKEKFGKDCFISVVMSGDFVQRGEVSFLNKWEKTKIALENEVDLVVELPVYYAIQNAEIFSKMAVKILDYLGMEIQVFGAENSEIKIFEEIVTLQKSEEYNKKIQEKIKLGNNYILSQRKILEEYGYRDFIKSNNILGLEYVRAILQDKLNIKPYIIKREISEYNEEKVEDEREQFVSASFIRKIFDSKDEKKWIELKNFIPKNIHKFLINKMYNKSIEYKNIKNEFLKLVKYRMVIDDKKKILEIFDMTEQLYSRIFNAILNSINYETFFKKIEAKNISIKRIDRILLNILLDIRKLDENIDYVRVLGFNDRGREYLKKLKKEEKNKIFVNWKGIEKSKEICRQKIKIEKNTFILKEMILNEKEKLNPIIK